MKSNCMRVFRAYQKYNFAYLAFILIFLNNSFTQAKVDPPNYDFSLNSLTIFKPGNLKSNLLKDPKYKKGKLYEKNGEFEIYRFEIIQLRYKFPIFVQFYQGKIIDYWAKLPSYFLHNIFLQSLQKRFGKHNSYFNKNSLSLYYWKNIKNISIVYSGTCTITCFPVFIYVRKTKQESIPGLKYLIDKFEKTF